MTARAATAVTARIDGDRVILTYARGERVLPRDQLNAWRKFYQRMASMYRHPIYAQTRDALDKLA